MPVTVGPYGQSQPSCFDRVKMGFVMGFAVGMAAGALFGTFSCLRCGGDGTGRDGTGRTGGSALLRSGAASERCGTAAGGAPPQRDGTTGAARAAGHRGARPAGWAFAVC